MHTEVDSIWLTDLWITMLGKEVFRVLPVLTQQAFQEQRPAPFSLCCLSRNLEQGLKNSRKGNDLWHKALLCSGKSLAGAGKAAFTLGMITKKCQ